MGDGRNGHNPDTVIDTASVCQRWLEFQQKLAVDFVVGSAVATVV
jgi:hypothetical protein